MRKLEYLSPSAINTFEKDPEEFYLYYVALDRPPKAIQTQPMSVGSAFDAFCKSWLHERLFGKGFDPRFEFNALFSAQVDYRNHDFAYAAGKHCFEEYERCGALADLLIELQSSINKPIFEIEVKGVIGGYREGVERTVQGITFLGKPDCFYVNKNSISVILDWKVNGYCSRYNIAPMPGYIRLRGDRSKSGRHKDAMLMMFGDTIINGAVTLEQLNKQWARQLSIYSWLCGANVGEEFIAAIDQLVCQPNGERPIIRIAEHRLKVGSEFQHQQFAYAQRIWEVIHSDWFFRDMSPEDSRARCAVLDRQAEGLRGDSEEDQMFRDLIS